MYLISWLRSVISKRYPNASWASCCCPILNSDSCCPTLLSSESCKYSPVERVGSLKSLPFPCPTFSSTFVIGCGDLSFFLIGCGELCPCTPGVKNFNNSVLGGGGVGGDLPTDNLWKKSEPFISSLIACWVSLETIYLQKMRNLRTSWRIPTLLLNIRSYVSEL